MKAGFLGCSKKSIRRGFIRGTKTKQKSKIASKEKELLEKIFQFDEMKEINNCESNRKEREKYGLAIVLSGAGHTLTHTHTLNLLDCSLVSRHCDQSSHNGALIATEFNFYFSVFRSFFSSFASLFSPLFVHFLPTGQFVFVQCTRQLLLELLLDLRSLSIIFDGFNLKLKTAKTVVDFICIE